MKPHELTISSKGQSYTQNLEQAQLTNLALALNQPPKPAPNSLPAQSHQGLNLLEEAFLETAKVPESRKLFVRGIAPNVTDSAIESLLQECGAISYFRRSRNERGEPVAFGIVEFREVEGVLNCVRLLQRFPVMGKRLEINMGEKAKCLIGEYIAFRKAELAFKFSGVEVSEAEIDRIITEELSHRDVEIQGKLERVAQAFNENREKILKMSEKSGVAAITEEKMNLYKQKFGLMNNKELNECFYRDLEKWLKREEEYDQKMKAESEMAAELHKRKMKLIEKEVEGNEEDYLPKNENHEKFLKRKKLRRIKVLNSDIQFLKENNMKINIELIFDSNHKLQKREILPHKKDSEEKNNQKTIISEDISKFQPLKKSKQEIIPMHQISAINQILASNIDLNQSKESKPDLNNKESTLAIIPQLKKGEAILSLESIANNSQSKQIQEEPKKTFADKLELNSDEADDEQLALLYAKKHRPLGLIPKEQIENVERQQMLENKTRENLKLALYK